MNYSVSQLIRLKNNVPFSAKLNQFCGNFVQDLQDSGEIKQIIYSSNDNFNTFEKIKKAYDFDKTLHIWTGASDNNIFGSSDLNILFRVWHDYTHVKYNLDFEPINEIQVCNIQMSNLPEDYNFEKLLINSDITGQVLYFSKFGEFPTDQRKFTIDFLKNSLINSKF